MVFHSWSKDTARTAPEELQALRPSGDVSTQACREVTVSSQGSRSLEATDGRSKAVVDSSIGVSVEKLALDEIYFRKA